MGSEWRETTLGEVLTLQRGFDLPETERQTGPHPVIASTGPVGTHSRAMVNGPGVVIGRSGSLGGGQYIESDFWPLNTTLWVKDFKGNDRRFCYYLLKSINLAHFNSGSGVPTLNRNHIHPLPVKVPSDPKEQRAIAHILGTLDDKIELNRKMNETLEAMAQAIFKRHFPYELDDDLPEGWSVKTIGDLADVVGGSTPSTKDTSFWNGGMHHWATPKDLSGLAVPVLLDTERCITDAGLAQVGSGLLPKGTVLLSSRAPIGYLVVAEIPVAINQGFIAMKPRENVSNLFLYFWTSAAHEEIVSRANGSTFLEISKSNFRPIPIIAPPATTMREFDMLARPLYERIVVNVRASRTLAALRDTLLPKLIGGELRVAHTKSSLKEAIV